MVYLPVNFDLILASTRSFSSAFQYLVGNSIIPESSPPPSSTSMLLSCAVTFRRSLSSLTRSGVLADLLARRCRISLSVSNPEPRPSFPGGCNPEYLRPGSVDGRVLPAASPGGCTPDCLRSDSMTRSPMVELSASVESPRRVPTLIRSSARRPSMVACAAWRSSSTWSCICFEAARSRKMVFCNSSIKSRCRRVICSCCSCCSRAA